MGKNKIKTTTISSNLKMLHYYLYAFFRNTYLDCLENKKIMVHDFLLYTKKTEYRLKNNLDEFFILSKTMNLESILCYLKEEEKKIAQLIKNVCFGNDYMKICFFTSIYCIQNSYYLCLIKHIEKCLNSEEPLNIQVIKNFFWKCFYNHHYDFLKPALKNVRYNNFVYKKKSLTPRLKKNK